MKTKTTKEMAVRIAGGISTEVDYSDLMKAMNATCERYFEDLELGEDFDMDDFKQEVYIATYDYLTSRFTKEDNLEAAFAVILFRVREKMEKDAGYEDIEEQKAMPKRMVTRLDEEEVASIENGVIDRIDEESAVEVLIRKLNPRYQDIMLMRCGIYPYTETHTYAEIANKYQVSIARVGQIFEKGKRKIRLSAKFGDVRKLIEELN